MSNVSCAESRGRPTAPSHERIVAAWPYDADEFACFACGWEYRKATTWKSSRLERAHIIGCQHGGSNDPGNFALLCGRCHIDAPDTPSPEIMMAWIVHREAHITTVCREALAAASLFGLDESYADQLSEVAWGQTLASSEFDSLMRQNLGTHGGRSNVATVIGALKLSLDQAGMR